MTANGEYRGTCKLKRCTLVLQLTTATQDLRPLIATTVAELDAHPGLLKLYNLPRSTLHVTRYTVQFPEFHSYTFNITGHTFHLQPYLAS
jgi:hypothetical protein